MKQIRVSRFIYALSYVRINILVLYSANIMGKYILFVKKNREYLYPSISQTNPFIVFYLCLVLCKN